ncbi:MAG: sulfur carrier protein ThiS, partial [Rhodospirillales bacterium]|nr:sulfur carrier protein ThiS [Rhodospirillales bacterium]
MQLTINGEERAFSPPQTLVSLLGELGIDPAKVAVERNREIVPKSHYGETSLGDGDQLEIVHFIGGGAPDSSTDASDTFEVAGQRYSSRLLVGTGKYKDFEETKLAIEASGAEIVTVAVRRVNITDPNQPMLVDYVDPKKYTYLPNTAGCFTADDAVRTLRLAREAGGWNLVKLEVLGDQKTL